jgi:hypothetical protein
MSNFLEHLKTLLQDKRQNKEQYDFFKALQFKGLHNHNIMAYELVNSAFFKDYKDQFYRDPKNLDIINIDTRDSDSQSILQQHFLKIQSKYNKHREYLLENFNTPERVKRKHLETFCELLCNHAIILDKFDPIDTKLELNRTTEECFDRVINGYKYVSDPENNELVYFQDVMNGAWTLIHLNAPQEALKLLHYMGTDFDLYLKGEKESMFQFLDSASHIPRMAQSLDWAFAWAYRQLGNTEAAAFYLEQITLRHPIYDPEDQMQIFWHTGAARLLEAAVELYKVQPTEVNKSRILDIIVNNYSYECQEPNESLREMLYAIWNATRILFYYPA